MEAFESEVLDLPDFYFTGDDYRYRFEPVAKQQFLEMLRERFNSAVRYKGRALKWDTIIEHKINELGRFLGGKSTQLGFGEPTPILQRENDGQLRVKVRALTYSQAKQIGIGKSTFHYMRQRVVKDSSLKLHKRTIERLHPV